MLKRVIWWTVGATMGAVGSKWAERKVKRKVTSTIAKYSPPAVAERVKDTAIQRGVNVVDGVRTAIDTGRQAADERQSELRAKYGIDAPDGSGNSPK
jgi:hypothetical protein